MSAPLVTPLTARCKVCGDTGSMSQDLDGHQDCTACDAVERRAELNSYLSGLSPFISPRATAWCAYDFGMRRSVATQPSAGSAAKDAQDAARYRFRKQLLEDGGCVMWAAKRCMIYKDHAILARGDSEEEAIDAARAAQGEKQ